VHVPKPDALDALYGRKRGEAESSHEGVYVRKWMRTRHSIIFRLSNNNFQVCVHINQSAPDGSRRLREAAGGEEPLLSCAIDSTLESRFHTNL
jgi:hypothetical protein